ncbi:MAG: DNA topoisomerase IV subunit B family protein [Aggregatilineales bacterium]
MDSNTNNADDLRVLSSVEAVRTMPGMYIGGTNQRALHAVVWCLIGHALHESSLGLGNQISVTIEPENIVRVTDDGLGLPLTPDPNTGRPLIEQAVTTHWAGIAWPGRQAQGNYRHHDAWYVGLGVPNAVSEKFTVEVKQQGYLWRILYGKGECQTELERVEALANLDETGTTIIFQPDYSIFQPAEIDPQYMYRSLRELAYLMGGFTIRFEDKRPYASHALSEFHFADGTADFVRSLNREYKTLHDPVVIRRTITGERKAGLSFELEVDIAVQYSDTQDFIIQSYVNGKEPLEGGVHIDGFVEGWSWGIGEMLEQIVLGGLAAVISIWHPAPQFEGAGKYKLISPEVKPAMSDAVRDALYELRETAPDLMNAMREKCQNNRILHEQRRYAE